MILKDLSKINSDMLDGRHASNSANNIPVLDANAKLSSSVIPTHSHSPLDISKDAIYNVAGGVSAIGRTLINTARACRTAFLPANGIVVEKSTDGGKTWVDYGLTNDQKRGLFSMNMGHTVKVGGEGISECTTNCLTRITITPVDRYVQVDTFYCWFSKGGHVCALDIERSTKGEPTKFTKIRENVLLEGWAGANEVSFSTGQFGGYNNQDSNHYSYRFTFKITSLNSSYKTSFPTITDIRMYGDNCWTSTNNMMTSDTIYNWDVNQNIFFPNTIQAKNVYVENNPSSGNHAINLNYLNSLKPTPSKYFVNGFAGMTSDGVMEVGKYQDWHNTSDETIDYSVRVMCNSSNGNTVILPSKSGTFALTTDNVASATKLQKAVKINGVEFDGTKDITIGGTGGGDIDTTQVVTRPEFEELANAVRGVKSSLYEAIIESINAL